MLEKQELSQYQKFYRILSIILCLSISLVLLWTITYLPEIGDAGNPDNNEVSARYIEQGLKETGAVNIVTGMILDYRAFDTFGESCVLFIASCCVLVLLRIDQGRDVAGTVQDRNNAKTDKHRDIAVKDPHSLENLKRLEAANDRLYEPKNDVILQKCSCVLVPLIFVFGVYIVLNGHLSPGGGFSGGAVLGSGLILYLNAFGFQKMEKIFNEKIYRRVTLSALTFYQELFLLYRGKSFGKRDSSGHAGGDFKQRADPALKYLCGAGGGLHHVCVLRPVQKGGNVGWSICFSIWKRQQP